MSRVLVLRDEFNVIPSKVFVAALAERWADTASPAVAIAAPPSSFLATVYCLSDNVPVGMFDRYGDAVLFAHEVARSPQPHIERFRKLAGYDPVFHKESSLLSVDVTEFNDGVPVHYFVVVNLEPVRTYPDALDFG